MQKMIIRNAKPFMLYIFFAGIATVVDFGLFYFLIEFAGFHYLVSNLCSCTAGMITNYAFNKKRTFKNRSNKIARQFSLFIFVSLIGIILNLIFIYLLVERTHMWPMYAKFISSGVVVFWSYIGHKKITFGLIR